jgi:hypothetical protein
MDIFNIFAAASFEYVVYLNLAATDTVLFISLSNYCTFKNLQYSTISLHKKSLVSFLQRNKYKMITNVLNNHEKNTTMVELFVGSNGMATVNDATNPMCFHHCNGIIDGPVE